MNKQEENDYYVNIEGTDVKVDISSDEEYSCLLNCLEGYYLYGGSLDNDSNENTENDYPEE